MQNPIVPIGHGEWIERAFTHSDRHDGRPAEEVDQEINEMTRRSLPTSQQQPTFPAGKSSKKRRDANEA